MRNHKAETSANVGFAIPDDDVTIHAKFQKNTEVFVKSWGEIGVVRAVHVKGRKFVYTVDTRSGSTICASGDLTYAGKAAMKAMEDECPTLDALCEQPAISADDVLGCIRSLGTSAKAVGVEDRAAASACMRCLKAAYAALRADDTAQDVAKAFVRKAADVLVAAPDDDATMAEDVQPEAITPDTNPPPLTTPDQMAGDDAKAAGKAAGVAAHVKALRTRIDHIKAVNAVSDEDEDAILTEAENLRAYTATTAADQMAALASLEESLYEPREPGLAAWADKVRSMIDQYQAHIATAAPQTALA